VAACGSVRQSDRLCQGLEVVEGFRTALYGCATRRADAWFELCDALLVTERLVSLPHLSLEPLHRRGHGSLYAALRHGEVAAERLRELLAAHLPSGPPVFAVDPTVWARCDAECSPGRGFYYHPSRHSAGQPIVAGWCYQLVVGLELQRDSWTAPVDVRRLDPADNSNLVAAGQIRALLVRLAAQQQPVPLVVFDGGFDPVQLQVELAEHPSRCWCASAVTGTSTPPAIPAVMGGRAARPATAPSCRWPILPPGRRPRPRGRRPTRSMGR
jgi:DDE superfamily endonuclease